MVLGRFLRILPISTHFRVNIFIVVVVVVEIKLNHDIDPTHTRRTIVPVPC